MQYKIILLYKYIKLIDVESLKKEIEEFCKKKNLLGRVIISKEGINLTLEGLVKDIDSFEKFLKSKKEFEDVDIKTSKGEGDAFPKISVKIKEEIVTTRFPKSIDPTKKTGKYISPKQLNEMYEKENDFIVIDMRNDYEYKSGHFVGSINPAIESSRELVKKTKDLNKYKNKKVVTVCTGGVRCEKMSAYLLNSGFKKVYQLKGGIHRYLEEFISGYFKGVLYTFDNRIVMDFTKNREVIGKCFKCNTKTEIYSHCANAECHKHLLVCKNCFEKEIIFCSDKCRDTVVRITPYTRLREHIYRIEKTDTQNKYI